MGLFPNTYFREMVTRNPRLPVLVYSGPVKLKKLQHLNYGVDRSLLLFQDSYLNRTGLPLLPYFLRIFLLRISYTVKPIRLCFRKCQSLSHVSMRSFGVRHKSKSGIRRRSFRSFYDTLKSVHVPFRQVLIKVTRKLQGISCLSLTELMIGIFMRHFC